MHPWAWQADDLNGAAVALADAEDEVEAATFEAAARGARAACNIIDKAGFCHFQFGTIINRSPVVVSVSTSGAAPILGQAIRRRIETARLAGGVGAARTRAARPRWRASCAWPRRRLF